MRGNPHFLVPQVTVPGLLQAAEFSGPDSGQEVDARDHELCDLTHSMLEIGKLNPREGSLLAKLTQELGAQLGLEPAGLLLPLPVL